MRQQTPTDWYCVRTNPRCENRAQEGLKALGLETYLPERRTLRKPRYARSKRPVETMVPLFTRYLFVGVTTLGWFYDIRQTDGVESLVGIQGLPIKISDREIARLRSLQADGVFDEGQRGRLIPGDEYLYEMGGAIGDLAVRILEDTGRDKVIAEADILGKSTRVEVQLDKLIKVA